MDIMMLATCVLPIFMVCQIIMIVTLVLFRRILRMIMEMIKNIQEHNDAESHKLIQNVELLGEVLSLQRHMMNEIETIKDRILKLKKAQRVKFSETSTVKIDDDISLIRTFPREQDDDYLSLR